MKAFRLIAMVLFVMASLLLLVGQNQGFAQEKETKGPWAIHSKAGVGSDGLDSLITQNPESTYWEQIFNPWGWASHPAGWPPYCYNPYRCYKWKDTNNSTYIDACDTLWLNTIPNGVCRKIHVDSVTLTLVLKRQTGSPAHDTVIYVEYRGFTGGNILDSLNWVRNNPVSTSWWEVRPDMNNYYNIDAINPGPPLQTCRNITLSGVVWHVEDVGTDIWVETLEVFPCPGTPTMTQWGIIILVGLIVASGVFVMLRRRKTAVPA